MEKELNKREGGGGRGEHKKHHRLSKVLKGMERTKKGKTARVKLENLCEAKLRVHTCRILFFTEVKD